MNDEKPTKPGNPKVKGKGIATERDRGKFKLRKGLEGHADYVEVCIRDTDGSFVWRKVTIQ